MENRRQVLYNGVKLEFRTEQHGDFSIRYAMCRLNFEKHVQPRPSVSIIYMTRDRSADVRERTWWLRYIKNLLASVISRQK